MKGYINFIILLIILVLSIFIIANIEDDNYPINAIFISNNGNDSNDGLTPETSIKTIYKLNRMDTTNKTVLFKRGDTWRLTDTYIKIHSNIQYSTYGTGEKPILLGSFELNNKDNWIEISNNIWRHKTHLSDVYSNDIGLIIYNNIEWGSKKDYRNELSKQRDFYYDYRGEYVYVYSINNPANMYDDIEISERTFSFDITEGQDNVMINGFDMKYFGEGAVGGKNNKNILVENCDTYFIGGTYHKRDTMLRFGNAIGFGLNMDNITIRNNYIFQTYDAGISPQAWQSAGRSVMKNIFVYDNIVTYAEFGFEFFNSYSTSKTSNMHIHDNIFAYSGHGFGNERSYNGGYGIMSNTCAIDSLDISFTNNIIYESTRNDFNIGRNLNSIRWKAPMPLINNNIYYGNAEAIVSIHGKDYINIQQLNIDGFELNGQIKNPNFRSPEKEEKNPDRLNFNK